MMVASKDSKKLIAATVDEQKRRNQIDRPLVEHDESCDSDNTEQHQVKSTTVNKRFLKLSLMVDNSTQEFKQKEREQKMKQKAQLLQV